MKRGKNRSEASLVSMKSDIQVIEEVYVPPMDVFTVKVLGLQVTDEVAKHFAIKVTFFDQLLLTGIIKTVNARRPMSRRVLAKGTMNYDPSDYEKMCLFADCPLVVNIQPLKSIEENLGQGNSSRSPRPSIESERSSPTVRASLDISCCNIDVLPVFTVRDKMCVQKRMQPKKTPPILQTKSWDNLPLITLEISVDRNEENGHHHKVFKRANYMKLTLVGAFNMQIPYDDGFVYTAASKTPLRNEMNTGLITFNQGYRVSKRFDPLCFYPKWECLQNGDDVFTKGDLKFVCDWESIVNNDNIDLKYYLSNNLNDRAIAWGSFHRTLMLDQDAWLSEHLRRYCWPFEVHVYGEENNGLSFMAFLNLIHLLYPGENRVRMAVPLHWVNPQTMQEKCDCDLLLTPNDNVASTTGSTPKAKLADSAPTSITDMGISLRPTGADDNCAFIIVEVKLARPLKKAVIPTPITSTEINDMLHEMELGPTKRENTGRGQLDRDWQSTVRSAEMSLRRVPHYGMTEFCAFNRQLSETRTRVELMTSCCLDAAIYVNNNFVVQEFLQSDDKFEEMLMMSHACLTRIACSTLVGNIQRQELNPTLRAARNARHMQDISHAQELYLQLVVQQPRCGNSWRELSTCLRDVDRDWANVCIDKSIVLDPRHPLSLVCKGCILYEDDPEAAEPFFVALLALHPFWLTGWVIANAYYTKRELFHMADQVMEYLQKTHAEGLAEDIRIPRAWEYELGDWWDQTPLLPGTNPYYDATDLLLRLRTFELAEVCLSRAIAEVGDSAASLHMIALSCRLRGRIDDALCHLQLAIEKYGDINYLRGLQAECFHKKKDIPAAMASFEKAGSALGAYSILLSMPCWEAQRARSLLLDLIRRQPSAYAWVALAEDWMQRAAVGEGGDGDVTEEQTAAKTCAAACAVQALKCDRQAGRAWALLSRLVVPSARRLHCMHMAEACGYIFEEERAETSSESQQSLCHGLGRALRECRCHMCEYLKF